MNICVCVKQVEETYARTGRDPDRHFLDPVDRIYRVNPYDESAMLLAVRAARYLEDARIFVLTIGKILDEEELWRIMAMGGHQLYHLELTGEDENGPSLDSWSKAQVLAYAVRAVQGDMVLCGKESIDGQNGLVAPFLARLLERPYVSSIIDLSLKPDAAGARMTKTAGKGVREIIECQLPAVFSVDLASGPGAMPPYAARQQAKGQNVTRLVFDTRALSPKTRRVSVSAPRPRPKPVPAPDSNLPSVERVRLLLAGSQVQKKGRMVSGSPETQVEEIIRFLQTHNLGPAAGATEPEE